MGLLQSLGIRKNDSTRDRLRLVPPWRRYSFAPFSDISEVVEDAYKKNATTFACMWILQSMFPEPELWAWERGDRYSFKPIQGHPIRKLMARPNPDMSEVEFLQFAITYAPLGGNFYAWKQRDQEKHVKHLWPLHDGQVIPIRGRSTAEGIVAYFVMDDGSNKQTNPWGVERFDEHPGVAIPKSEMIHWKWMIDPLNPERGMGALEASAGDVRVANEIRDYIYSFLKNDATPPIVVFMADGDEYSEEKAKRLKEQWMESGGGSNRGTPRFLEFGMEAKQMSWSLRDMEFGDLGDRPDTAVTMGFHIHPAVVGTMAGMKNSTYSNFEEANRALALQTLIPMWRALASELQQGLAEEIGFSEEETLKFDTGQVRALQESEKEREEVHGSAFDRGGITRGEYRRAIGYEATEEDEVYKENLASVWVPRGQLRSYDPDLLEDEEERQGGDEEDGKGRELKAREQAQDIGNVLLKIRRGMMSRMRDEIKNYSERLADQIVQRLKESGKSKEDKSLPGVDDLILPDDLDKFETLIKRFYSKVLEASWGTWNVALGVEVAFDLNDPIVTEILGMAGDRVQNITDVTKQNLRGALQVAGEEGWGVDKLIAGDPDAGVLPLREIVEETYQNRSKAIARTELGMAQNAGTINRYGDAGVKKVLVLDNGFDRSDENCVWIAGKVRPLSWTKSDHPGEGPSGIKNPLQHPNCVRCFSPYFGDE